MIRIGMAESMPEDIADEMAVLIRKAPTDRQGFGLRCSAFGLAASDKLPRQDEGQERRGKRTKNKVTMPARGVSRPTKDSQVELKLPTIK
jgi:hypothetical protein